MITGYADMKEMVKLERKIKVQPSPAVVFARQYASMKGIQKVDYRKLVAHRALQRRGFDSLLEMIIYQIQRDDLRTRNMLQKPNETAIFSPVQAPPLQTLSDKEPAEIENTDHSNKDTVIDMRNMMQNKIYEEIPQLLRDPAGTDITENDDDMDVCFSDCDTVEKQQGTNLVVVECAEVDQISTQESLGFPSQLNFTQLNVKKKVNGPAYSEKRERKTTL
jgi:hypothetical protein